MSSRLSWGLAECRKLSMRRSPVVMPPKRWWNHQSEDDNWRRQTCQLFQPANVSFGWNGDDIFQLCEGIVYNSTRITLILHSQILPLPQVSRCVLPLGMQIFPKETKWREGGVNNKVLVHNSSGHNFQESCVPAVPSCLITAAG